MKRLVLTYGQMPGFKDFVAAYNREMEGRRYSIRGPECSVQGRRAIEADYEGDYDASELFDLVSKLSVLDDEEQSLASAILETLNIEWV